ncbi:MAG: UvrD-helicase domain-containing protein [Candidatus Aminicenantes bacterium]|nr:UvrD-helicase domain-containing protein [Candidatus Aminicenantes bacterium]
MAKPIVKLEASAGSGKTYRLALEYLSRLLLAFAPQGKKPIDPRRGREMLGSILAITFTVKAAREMKERILEKLKRFALSDSGSRLAKGDREFLDRLAAETGLDSGRIIELSSGLIELVLASYDDFNVTTIDSLMSAMVKAVSPDLDLPADYEIAVDAGNEMESRGRAMLARLADDDWPRLEVLLRDMRRLSQRIAWKTDEEIVAKVMALFRRMLRQESGDIAPGDLPRQMSASWDVFRDALVPLHPILQERETDGRKRRFVSGTYLKDPLLAHIARTMEEGADFDRMEEFIKSTFFRKEDPRKLLIGDAPDGYRERFIAAYRTAQRSLRDAVLAFSAYRTLPYRELLGDFGEEWRQGKQTLFVEEFSHSLAGLFGQWCAEAFPYLYLKLSDRFHSFLFDEFQDTSTLQFKALAPLIDEVLSRKERGSLFVVGDRKQAIYRWRGGNSELMDERRLREEVPAIDHLSPEGFSATLDRNWRSGRVIVKLNNDFWHPQAIARIAAESRLREVIEENFKDSQQELPEGREAAGGYVELSLHAAVQESGGGEDDETDTPEEEGLALSSSQLDEIERIIRRLHEEHGYEHSDIAVLLRKNAQVRAVIRRLGRRNISSLSDQSLLLSANARVAEIIAFLRFLDFPPDDLNFFAFVTGRIFQEAAGRSFPEEMTGFSEKIIIDCRGPFYKLFQERFPLSWKSLIEPFFQAVGFLPPYDLFSDFTQAFHVYENFAGDTPFIQALGDALHRAELDNGSSIAGFLHQWQRMAENESMPSVTIPENAPGVRVLTMHQSKGLEFPAVIVPVDDSGSNSGDNLHWDRQGLFYIQGNIARAHPALAEMYEKENARGTIDLLNLLYVAFTRAKEALFVPVAVRRTTLAAATDAAGAGAHGLVRKISRASDILVRHPLLQWQGTAPVRPYSRGKLLKRAGMKAGPRDHPGAIPSKKTFTRSWQSRYLVFHRADPSKRGDRQAAKRGERFHDLLSRLGPVGDRGEIESRVRAQAGAAGWPAGDIEAVTGFLRRDEVFDLLSRPGDVFSEKEVISQSGALPELRRLDRLQAGAGEILVIDFKTGNEKDPRNNVQVQGYMTAVAPLFPGRVVRGFLLYIDRGEVEEVECSS